MILLTEQVNTIWHDWLIEREYVSRVFHSHLQWMPVDSPVAAKFMAWVADQGGHVIRHNMRDISIEFEDPKKHLTFILKWL